MANNTLECYVLPATPLPLLLPIECVAAVVEKPDVQKLAEAPANWMKGYVTWDNQRVPVLSYSALHDSELDESKKRKPVLFVLNPIPDAVRKAFSGLLCFGKVEKISVDDSMIERDLPDKVDRRYVEASIEFAETQYLIPKLTALGVAFSYF